MYTNVNFFTLSSVFSLKLHVLHLFLLQPRALRLKHFYNVIRASLTEVLIPNLDMMEPTE